MATPSLHGAQTARGGALVPLPRVAQEQPLDDPRRGDVDEWGRSEHMREIEAVNDRLHAARMAESVVLSDWREEIVAIAEQLEQQELPLLRRSIVAYHRRRQRRVMEIVRALHQLPTSS